MPRFILLNETTGLYFTPPMGEEMSEWSDNPREARTWADLDSCQAAAKTWKMIHDVELRALQITSGPHFHSVVAPGTPAMEVVIHGY